MVISAIWLTGLQGSPRFRETKEDIVLNDNLCKSLNVTGGPQCTAKSGKAITFSCLKKIVNMFECGSSNFIPAILDLKKQLRSCSSRVLVSVRATVLCSA